MRYYITWTSIVAEMQSIGNIRRDWFLEFKALQFTSYLGCLKYIYI